MTRHVYDNAKRCLQCKNPQCVQGCPVKTPIRDMIELLLNGKIEDAGDMLFHNNPLSLVCSHVCPQENQCEGHCILGKKGMPVHISSIEQYISDYYLSVYKPRPSLKNKGKVAIVGAGPAGLTIAFFLAEKDYDVTIFENNDRIGGILRYGIPEFRLPKSILDRMMELLLAFGVRFRPNTTIGASVTVDELFRDGYQAIFLGTGTWRPLKLNIKGESLGHVHFAIEYLRNPEAYRLGKRVLIIGAGNVAMDVARTAIRHGSREVNIMCLKGDKSITAREVEVEYAKMDGVSFEFNKIAVELVDEGAVFAESRIVKDENGNERVEAVPETEELFPADSVIIAISQGPRSVIVSSTRGIELKENGLVRTDEYGRTTREGVFASGDVVTGAKTVVEAVRLSRLVAEAIDEYVRGKAAGRI